MRVIRAQLAQFSAGCGEDSAVNFPEAHGGLSLRFLGGATALAELVYRNDGTAREVEHRRGRGTSATAAGEYEQRPGAHINNTSLARADHGGRTVGWKARHPRRTLGTQIRFETNRQKVA